MRKKILITAVSIVVLAVLGIGTYAYFTQEAQTQNVITTGSIRIELNERTADPGGAVVNFSEEGIIGALPGKSVSQIVSVSNSGTGDAYIRVRLDISVSSADGEALSTECISLNLNEEEWNMGSDGYYYYQTGLASGETTPVLFDTVTFSEQMGNAYQKSTIRIDVSAQAVQCANNVPDSGNPEDALGWPASIEPTST